MIYPKHVLDLIIKPVIDGLGLDDKNKKGAYALLLYTAQQESNCGQYLTQLGGGPARSVWQIERATYEDRFDNYLIYRPKLLDRLVDVAGTAEFPDFEYVAGNMYLACAVARIVYRKSPLPIPEWNDLDAMWKIYKSAYNSYLGAADMNEFINNCRQMKQYLM